MRKIESSFSPDIEEMRTEETEIEQEQGAEQLDDKEKTKVSGFFAHLDALSEKVFGPDAVKEVKEAWQENVVVLFRDFVEGIKKYGLFVDFKKLDSRERKKILALGFRVTMVVGGLGAALAPEEADAQEVELDVPDMGEDVEFVLYEDEEGNTQWDIESFNDEEEITDEELSLYEENGAVNDNQNHGDDVASIESASAHQEVKYQGGTSVWEEAREQLKARFQEKFTGDDLSDAERTYDIDKVEDLIEKHPEQYGLPKDINFNKMSTEQIASVNWDKAIEDSKITAETIDPNLSAEAEKNIEKNNEKISQWAKEHPRERLDSERVDSILSGEETDERVVIPKQGTENKELSEKMNPFENRLKQNLALNVDIPESHEYEPKNIDLDGPHNLLDKQGMSVEEKEISQAINNYQGKAPEGINTKYAQEMAAKTLLESAKGGDFEKLLEYGDYKETLKEATENALNDEISKGDGKLKFGSPNQEKILEFVHNLSRVYGLKEDESAIFESWLAGDDNKIDRNDLKEKGLYDKRHFKEDLFGDKVKEFLDIAKSKELPGKNWEPRTIHYVDEKDLKHDEIMNVRESDVSWYYEFDSDGDKHPNSDPRIENGSPGKRFPKDMAEAWLKEPEAQTLPTTAENAGAAGAEPQKTTGADQEKPSTVLESTDPEKGQIDDEKQTPEDKTIDKMKKVHADELNNLGINVSDGLTDEERENLKDYYNFYVQETKTDPLNKKPLLDSLDQFLKDNNLDPKEFQPSTETLVAQKIGSDKEVLDWLNEAKGSFDSDSIEWKKLKNEDSWESDGVKYTAMIKEGIRESSAKSKLDFIQAPKGTYPIADHVIELGDKSFHAIRIFASKVK